MTLTKAGLADMLFEKVGPNKRNAWLRFTQASI